ncbi:hypothetical protein K438DRAFT_1798899 [Mycena galopus ATCC 62051]|nr:hypothetical protein K438DRAFT_1798899 [Mycena galopus ATCC 62051]
MIFCLPHLLSLPLLRRLGTVGGGYRVWNDPKSTKAKVLTPRMAYKWVKKKVTAYPRVRKIQTSDPYQSRVRSRVTRNPWQ